MPILLPVLVRRSVRETTVAATRPALAPDFTERENSVHDCTLSFCSSGAYSSSGWPDRKKPMASYSRCSLSAASQGSTAGMAMVSRLASAAEHVVLPDRDGLMRALRGRHHGVDGGVRPRAVRLERIEGAGGGEAFQHALVDRARIDAAGEVGEIGERLVAARRDDAVDRLPADAFERRERVIDRVALDLEGRARAIDRRRLDLDVEPLGLGAEFRQLVGVAHVERHRRRHELDRIIRLHDRRSGRRPARRPRRGSC